MHFIMSNHFFRRDKEIQQQLFKDQHAEMVSTIKIGLKNEFIFKSKEVINETLRVVKTYAENIDNEQVLQEVFQKLKIEFLDEIETFEIGTQTIENLAENSVRSKILKFGEPIHRSLSSRNLSAFVGEEIKTVPPVIDLVSPNQSKIEES